tara:strand:+ start:2236 stop:2415 length:180 start_codon:yes stop_codon:yes gene_type:complete
MQEIEEITEGWYLCLRNGKELQMYNDGNGTWHLSAHHTDDVVFSRIAKNPDVVLKKISK